MNMKPHTPEIILEFETETLIDEDFPNNKPNAKDGARWYTRSQPCLIFKESSKYPDKFELNLSFSDNKQTQQGASGFAVGRYKLSPEAHGFDNRRRPVCNYTKLLPLSE